MATVVDVLRSVTPPASSTPRLCSVIAASVDSGSMSEMDPMNVVLPTAKPPAMTILTVMGEAGIPASSPAAWSCGWGATVTSECGNAIENTLQDLEVGGGWRGGGRTRVHDDQPLVGQVTDEDPDDAQGQRQVGGQLGDGQDLLAGQVEDAPTLGGPDRVVGTGDHPDQRLQWEVRPAGAGPPAGEGVGADDPGLLDRRLLVVQVVVEAARLGRVRDGGLGHRASP